jgi:hypothetical protein
VKPSVQSPAASQSEQRRAHRFPVAVGRQLTVVDIGGQMFDGRVVNISASGLQVVVIANRDLPSGTVLQVLVDEVWLPAEVVHAEAAGDRIVMGLRRLQENFAADDSAPATESALRDLMPAGLFFWLVTAALVGLVVVVVLSPTPKPKHPVAQVRTQPVTNTMPASRRSSSGKLSPDSSTPSAGRSPTAGRVRKPDAARPTPTNRPPAKPDATTTTNNSNVATPNSPRPPDAKPRQATEQSPSLFTIVDDPEMSADLGLDEDQRRALRKIQEQAPSEAGDQAALEVLTPAQRARWEERNASTGKTP